jgi:DNA-binding transcriptional ArsR family regulator
MEQDEERMHQVYASLFGALANVSRLRILCLLSQHGELCVGELESAMKHKQSLTSYHLCVLERHDLVARRENGARVHYRLNRERLSDFLSSHCCQKILEGEKN